MNIGGIFTVGGWFLLIVGALCTLIFGKGLLFEKGQGFSLLMAVLVLGVTPIAAGVSLIGAGRRRSRLEKETQERGFQDTVAALARKAGGQVSIAEVTRATALPSDE